MMKRKMKAAGIGMLALALTLHPLQNSTAFAAKKTDCRTEALEKQLDEELKASGKGILKITNTTRSYWKYVVGTVKTKMDFVGNVSNDCILND